MKRGWVIAILFLVVLSVSVSALDRTRLFGIIEPNGRISLTLTYTSNGMRVTDQLVVKEADQYGQWEYKMASDMGEIHVVTRSGGFEEAYDVLSGEEFEIDLLGYGGSTEENETAVTTENETASEEASVGEETANETTTEEAGVEQEETGSSGISGLAVFEGLKINNSSFGIIIVFVALFITIIVANLVSHGIMNFGARVRERRIESRGGELGRGREINVVKLSDRLAEKQAENQMREDEVRKQREYDEWRKKQVEKEKRIAQLKKQLKDLEG